MPIRVLSSAVDRVKFDTFDNPSVVDGGYIALSHRWQDVEQPYEEVLQLAQEEEAIDSWRLSTKVRECHRLARAYGCPWFWVDAPCIDQRNSAELSEAIASMYDWYAQATICFAYLFDVPPDDSIRDPGSAFRRSEYFRRGWTLQELIAPRRVIFLYNDWSVLGDKLELADILEEVTGIDHDVLTFRRALSDVSVAQHLSWAARRETRRAEDTAYCLMGLFGIHIPVLYGEGPAAFIRLQLEILQKVRDHTLLAWTHSPRDPLGFAPLHTSIPSIWPLAPSPAAFAGASHLAAVHVERFVAAVSPLCEMSNFQAQTFLPCIGPVNHHGIACRLPVLYHGTTPFAALLACQEEHSTTSYIALAPHSKHPLLPGIFGVGGPVRPRKLSVAPHRPPSRLLRVNLDLLAPLVSNRQVLAGAVLWSPAFHVRFTSFHIAATTPGLPFSDSSLPEIPRRLFLPPFLAPTPWTFLGSDLTANIYQRISALCAVHCPHHPLDIIQALHGAFLHSNNLALVSRAHPPR